MRMRLIVPILSFMLLLCLPMTATAAGCSGCTCAADFTCTATNVCNLDPLCGGHDFGGGPHDIDCSEHCSGLPNCSANASECSKCHTLHDAGQHHNHCEWDWVTDVEPTCSHTGTKHEQCRHCGTHRNEGTVIPALNHANESPTILSGTGSEYWASSMEPITYTREAYSSVGHKSFDCLRYCYATPYDYSDCYHSGHYSDDHYHYRDEYLNVIYVRFQNSDGTFPGYTQYSSEYLSAGQSVSYYRAEDEDFQETSVSLTSANEVHIIYIDIIRRGYMVHYDANTGNGTGNIPEELFVYGLTYNVSTNSTAFTKDGYRHLGWSYQDDAHPSADAKKIPTTVAEAMARFSNDLYVYPSATSKRAMNFGHSVKDLALPGGSVTLYALWKPLWTLTLDYTIVSMPFPDTGLANPDNHSHAVTNRVDVGPYKWYDLYDSISRVQSKIGDNHHFTAPTIIGWTFKGWEVEGVAVDDNTVWTWDKNIVAHPRFQENRYKVNYHDKKPKTNTLLDSYLTGNNEYENTYSVLGADATGFTHPGFYLDGWAITNNNTGNVNYKVPIPDWIEPGRTYYDQYKQLRQDDGGIYDMYAVWKPIPIRVRIWDNYQLGTKNLNAQDYSTVQNNPNDTSTAARLPEAPYVEYIMYATEPTVLPQRSEILSKLGTTHNNAVLQGFVTQETHDSPTARLDYLSVDYKPAQEYTVPLQFVDINSPIQPCVNLYCVWDDVPKITCKQLPKLDYDTAIAQGIEVSSSGVVKMSDLEKWCISMADVRATDYEYTKRYGSQYVPHGYNNGYQVKIASFDPIDVHDTLAETKNGDQHKNTASYLVTFIVIDDAGNTATCSTELYFGSEMSIMIDSN